MKNYLIAAAAASMLWVSVAAASDPVDPVNKNRQGIALDGYDAVAYARQKKPAKGSPQFSFPWMGATWWFSNAEDRDLFAKDPQKYAPQFGGYCSYAVSEGHTATVDPDAWKIVNGKLYLNYSKSVQKEWEKDVPGRISKGEKNWPALHK